MKSLVTGGAGFIGSNLVDRLLDLGHEVVVIDNESSKSHEKFYWNENAENYNLDICDYESTRVLYDNVYYVFYLAAESSIPLSIENPIGTMLTNTLGTCTVLQCAREANVKRVMYSSTSAAYGSNSPPNVETQLDDCLNPYSVSKVSGEKICKMYTDLYDLPTIIFRYFNVYGERQPVRGQYAPAIGIFLRQRLADEPLTIVGDGNQRRDFVYVGDVCNANILAATSEVDCEFFGQVYNVGTGVNYSINEIAKIISDKTVNIAPRPGEARISLANNQKLKRVFGWTPKMELEKWIQMQIK